MGSVNCTWLQLWFHKGNIVKNGIVEIIMQKIAAQGIHKFS